MKNKIKQDSQKNYPKKKAIKKPKINKKKNIVFNIDLSNDKNNDFSKSEDIIDNSLSNDDKI